MSTPKHKPSYKTAAILLITLIILSNTPPAQYFLLPHYHYQNSDGSFQYSEEPGKGMDFQAGQIQFEAWKQQNKNNPHQTLYRTFSIRPWAFWEWWQFLVYSERFSVQALPQ